MMGNQQPPNHVAQIKFMDWGTNAGVDDDDIDRFVDACWESCDEESDSDFQ